MASTLQLRLLGGFQALEEGRPIEAFASQRLRGLVAYLALHGSHPLQRRRVAFALWPDSNEKQALNNLRNVVYVLRAAWPGADGLLEVGRDAIGWKQGSEPETDVAVFSSALCAADEAIQRGAADRAVWWLRSACDAYGGDLLPERYDEWLTSHRELLHDAHVSALRRLCGLLEDDRSYAEAAETTRRLLVFEPTSEKAFRDLMRLQALAGDRAAALQTYRRCREVLRQELDVDVDEETRAQHERIARGHASDDPEAVSQDTNGGLRLVGRREEWRRLRTFWERMRSEGPRLVVVSGEAGIGKTRLVEELERWIARQGWCVARARCYAAEGGLAYSVAVEWLRSPALHRSLGALQSEWRRELVRLLPEFRQGLPSQDDPGQSTDVGSRRRLFEALARGALSAGRPTLLVLDDLQWCDQDSLEWVRFLLRWAGSAQLMVVCTARSEELAEYGPVDELQLDLERDGRLGRIELPPLDRDETLELAGLLAETKLDRPTGEWLFGETEGNPLFVVESVRSELERADPFTGVTSLREGSSAALPEVGMPGKIHAVVARRLARLSERARDLAKLAATIGRSFDASVLQEASELDRPAFLDALDELWRGQVFREGGSHDFDFTHDKLREAAYADLSPVRRRLFHRRAGEALEALHASDPDSVAADLAMHYDRAGDSGRAIDAYDRAAAVAHGATANREAERMLRRAQILLQDQPPGAERTRRELSLLTRLGPVLVALNGWADEEVGRAYGRAWDLSGQEPAGASRLSALWGRWTFYLVRSELDAMRTVSGELAALESGGEDPLQRRAAGFATFYADFHTGGIAACGPAMERALAVPVERADLEAPILPGLNLVVFVHAYASHLAWHRGDPTRARCRSDEALRFARDADRPFAEAIALSYAAMLHQLIGDREATEVLAAEAIELCRANEFTYYEAWARILHGWAVARAGRPLSGVEELNDGMEALKRSRTVLREAYYYGLLADALYRSGRRDEALSAIQEASARALRHGERWHEPELLRLRAIATRAADAAVAERLLQRALSIAYDQGAVLPALRSALTLAEFLTADGRKAEAGRLAHRVLLRYEDEPSIRQVSEVSALAAMRT